MMVNKSITEEELRKMHDIVVKHVEVFRGYLRQYNTAWDEAESKEIIVATMDMLEHAMDVTTDYLDLVGELDDALNEAWQQIAKLEAKLDEAK